MKTRQSKDSLRYYLDWFLKSSHNILFKMLSAFSFLMLFFYFIYIVYHSTVEFDPTRVLVGCISLWTMIHLNKSL